MPCKCPARVPRSYPCFELSITYELLALRPAFSLPSPTLSPAPGILGITPLSRRCCLGLEPKCCRALPSGAPCMEELLSVLAFHRLHVLESFSSDPNSFRSNFVGRLFMLRSWGLGIWEIPSTPTPSDFASRRNPVEILVRRSRSSLPGGSTI